MSFNKNRKSILRKITDSLSFMVPSNLIDKNSTTKNSRAEYISVENTPSFIKDHNDILNKYDADLDNDNDSVNSGISLSTSGVSSLNPKHKDTKISNVTHKYFGKRKNDSIIEEEPATASSCKRICVQADSNFLQGNDSNTTRISYGSQYPTITRTFQTSSSVKYDVEDKRSHSQTAASIVLGSTARKMLERIEKFRTPLHSASNLPHRSNQYKSTYANDVWKASRYPPYMNAFKRYKMMISKTREEMDKGDTVGEEKKEIITQFRPKSPERSTNVARETTKVNNFSTGSIEKETPTFQPGIPKGNSERFTFSDPIHIGITSHVGISGSFTFSHPIKLENYAQDMGNKQPITLEPKILSAETLAGKREPEKSLAQNLVLPKKALKFNDESLWRCTNCFMEMPNSKKACSKCWMPKNFEQDNESGAETASGPESNHDLEDEGNVDLDDSFSNKKVDEKKPAILMTQVKSEKWDCSTCLVQNDVSDSKCKCCSADRVATSKTDDAPKMNSLIVQPPSNNLSKSWECPTCLVSNKMESDKCQCCTTKNPNNKENDKIDETSSKPSLFNFGTKASALVNESSTGLFGGEKPNDQKLVFNFGATKSTSDDSNKLFKFGNTNTAEKSATETKPFQFSLSNTTPTTNQTTTNKGFNFSFGTTAKTATDAKISDSPSVPVFNFGLNPPSASNPAPASIPKFGESLNNKPLAIPQSDPVKESSLFKFGSTPLPTQQQSTFQAPSMTAPASTGFNFSSFATTTDNKPAFNFFGGSTAPSAQGNAAPFAFGSLSNSTQNQPQGNPFNFEANKPATNAPGASNLQNRVFRKAARRLKK